MKNATILLPCLLMLALFFSNCQEKSAAEPAVQETAEPMKEDLVKRGEYLTITTGCDHCHTPKKMTPQGPVPDMDRWMMGYPSGDSLPEIDKTEITPGKWALFNSDLTAAVGPWGISFSANLTPHETGIGTWTFEHFQRAMKEGKHKGLENGRPIMPPMPWQAYSNMNDDDLKAIFTYLKSIDPIENLVPAYIPPNQME